MKRRRFCIELSTQFPFDDKSLEYLIKDLVKEEKVDLNSFFNEKYYLDLTPKEIRGLESIDLIKAIKNEGIKMPCTDHRKMANALLNRVIIHNGTEEQINKLAKSKIIEILNQEKIEFNQKNTAKELLVVLNDFITQFREKQDDNQNKRKKPKGKMFP